MEWQQAQRKLGTFCRGKSNKLCVDVRFRGKKLSTPKIRSETEGKFYYDIGKLLEEELLERERLEWELLERELRGGAGSSSSKFPSRGPGVLNFLEESLLIPLEGVLPKNFQLCNRKMKKNLMSKILKLAREAAQKFEQSQATHPPPKLSAQAIQSVDACLATVDKSFGRQRVDEDGRPPKLHDASTLEEHSLKTDEEVGLCWPMDKIDDASEVWLSKCGDSAKDLDNLADP